MLISFLLDGVAVADQAIFFLWAIYTTMMLRPKGFITMLLGAHVSTPPANTEVWAAATQTLKAFAALYPVKTKSQSADESIEVTPNLDAAAQSFDSWWIFFLFFYHFYSQRTIQNNELLWSRYR